MEKSQQHTQQSLIDCVRAGIGPAFVTARHTRETAAGDGMLLDADHTYLSAPARSPAPVTDREKRMARKKSEAPTEEPMGIVISQGLDRDPEPTVLAFVWGPADIDTSALALA
jgi:hypothetical protein